MIKIAVIGEAFTDRYWLGMTNRLSAEAPIPVVRIAGQLNLPGGAANVAANIEALGAEAKRIYPQCKTPVKNRLMVDDHQLARWDENDTCSPLEFGGLPADDWDVDGIVISDYGKGAFTLAVIHKLALLSGSHLPIFIDTKQDPFLFGAFKDPFFFPNLAEYRAYRSSYEDLDNVVLKRGAEGLQFNDQKWPAGANQVVSVNGAGDTVIAAFAVRYLELAWKADPVIQANFALEWAALASAIACERPYTSTPSRRDVERRALGSQPVR